MNLIDRLTDSANQRFTIFTIDEGERVECVLKFSASQSLWFLSLTYNDITINNISVVNSPNILRAHKNILPFGLLVIVQDGFDPYFITDFLNERVRMFILSRDEVREIEVAFN